MLRFWLHYFRIFIYKENVLSFFILFKLFMVAVCQMQHRTSQFHNILTIKKWIKSIFVLLFYMNDASCF